jgi:hypothetical protein
MREKKRKRKRWVMLAKPNSLCEENEEGKVARGRRFRIFLLRIAL